ncbi:MAG: (2Fe-2S)-binding protein [Deltaproteobacteria bacterium]|nr:(2Fe-2S)-binding protein [Deltaproteobacteria bacterium]
MRLAFEINSEPVELEIKPNQTLLEVIRRDLALTGTKDGCGIGECGVCTVLLDGWPIRSCLALAMDARGRKVTTIEGLAQGSHLHPLQESFIKHAAIQCGFCIPGMLMVGKALLDENPRPTEDEVRASIAGNLCRCTGYTKIVEAILAASEDRG